MPCRRIRRTRASPNKPASGSHPGSRQIAGPSGTAAQTAPTERPGLANPDRSVDTTESPSARSDDPPERPPGRFFVAGIGASAGGLEAVSELLRHVPDGIAYIVVQHLAPDHESLLPKLLARTSRLQVVAATDGMELEPNRVYVIPPRADLAVACGVIRIVTPSPTRGPHLPIDYLFRSLAEDQGPSAIGIVLSGTGADGTLGLKAIRAVAGLTFVQEPATAKYDGMPQSALASGAADYCLPLQEIAAELARIAAQHVVRPPARPSPEPPPDQNSLGELFALIRSEFDNDLTQYKPATINRRIERRMTLQKLERLEDYVGYVQENHAELETLYNDILISVTRFFRDPGALEALKTEVLQQLVERKGPSQPLRFWVPACATGEEAYSIAMCLLEVCEEAVQTDRIRIFGTDIDEDALEHARRGVYPATIALDISPERLHRFFAKNDGAFQVSRRLRELLVFSRHNLLKDTPFSRIDLVSCRNLLIYLTPRAQERVLRALHYALHPSGHLLLGTSETVGDAADLFSPVDRKNKIYAKKPVAGPVVLDLGFGSPASIPAIREPAPAPPPAQNLQALADRKVLDLYGPPGVVVSEGLEILQFRGNTAPYLNPTPGVASLNLLKLLRFELHGEIKRCLHQARSERLLVTSDITYTKDGKHRLVKLDIIPLQEPETKTRCFLVLFHSPPPAESAPTVTAEPTTIAAAPGQLLKRIQELEQELSSTREDLRTTTEEKQTTLEELQSANEELQSSNEELQSANEELETSKEEMQSTNEELTTVNEELHNRMTELSQTNDDLHNVLAGVDNAVVIVGMDLRIRRYTIAAERLLNLVPGDIGRSISFLDSFLAMTGLEPKVSTVIHSLFALEEEFLASNQRWYTLRVSPYKTLDHAIRGALVTLVDIDIRKRAIDMTRDVGTYATRFLGAISHPLLILDRKLRVVWLNGAFLSAFQLSLEETEGSILSSLGTRQFADPGLSERLEGVFASASFVRDYEMRLMSADGSERRAWVGASLIPASTQVPLALLSVEFTPPINAQASDDPA